jgi:hypothetical protein
VTVCDADADRCWAAAMLACYLAYHNASGISTAKATLDSVTASLQQLDPLLPIRQLEMILRCTTGLPSSIVNEVLKNR